MFKTSLAIILVLLFALLPASTSGATSAGPQLKPSKGPIGTLVNVYGPMPKALWANKTVDVDFNSAFVAQTNTNSSGYIDAKFFVPAIVSGNYNVSLVSGRITAPIGKFDVTFGTDSISKNFSALYQNMTVVRNLIREVQPNVSIASAGNFGVLNSEISTVNGAISNINGRITNLTAILVASESARSSQNQLLLYSIATTVAVGAVLLVALFLSSRGRRRLVTNDWNVLD